MSKSQNSFIKHQKALKKKKKKEEKLQKRLDKKHEETDGSLQNMLAYVDEFGNIHDEPIEDNQTPSTKWLNLIPPRIWYGYILSLRASCF